MYWYWYDKKQGFICNSRSMTVTPVSTKGCSIVLLLRVDQHCALGLQKIHQLLVAKHSD
jgi:hypothetical protein